MDIVKSLYEFVENTENNAINITADGKGRFEDIEKYVSGLMTAEDTGFFVRKALRTGDKAGLIFTEEQALILYLFYAQFAWHRSEQVAQEGFLKGGFAFSGSAFSFRESPFWDISVKLFLEYQSENQTNLEFIKKLTWIESPTQPIDQAGTPYFGCILAEKGKYPDQFYFYDSGLVHSLSFKSYDDYVTAMINTAAVYCWQYFYTDPEEIIRKNKGISHLTWALHSSTTLGDDYKQLLPVPGADKYDRLDMINEYLERCVRLLPDSFPFLDFSYHKKWYEQFSQLYRLHHKQ